MTGSSAKPGLWTTLQRNLNFFRIHLLFFTFTPLIFSVILYASNGRYPIKYIDALFNSVSAITVCGLGTVNLSQLTPWQQTLLFIQMCTGSPVVVSWFMVYIRRHFFAKKFAYILLAEAARREVVSELPTTESLDLASATGPRRHFGKHVTSLIRRRTGLSLVPEETERSSTPQEKENINSKLSTNMIRRMDGPPKRVNPDGLINEGIDVHPKRLSTGRIASGEGQEKDQPPSPVRTATPGNIHPASSSLGKLNTNISPTNSPQLSPAVGMPRTTTIEFAPNVARHHVPGTVLSRQSTGARDRPADERPRGQRPHDTLHSRRYPVVGARSQISLARHPSHTSLSGIDPQGGHSHSEARHTGFGGFPMPQKVLSTLFRHLFPRAANRLRKSLTIPATATLSGGEQGRTASITGVVANLPEGSKPVSYISFDAIVGRNSVFHMLTNDQLEELGGVEYRGLNALLWLVAVYHFGCQLVAFVVIAPYMALPKWASDFVPPALIRPVSTPWFSLFQVVSTYTNTGFSLVDQSMVPFQTAYPMIFFMVFLILAGNTAFPIFLRLMIWTIAKLIPTRSRLYETLHFLLDHPRRCFVYLFPSYQTWFLFFVLILLNSIDFFCFMVLDIGSPATEAIPFGNRFAIGILQSVDVRASGFSLVTIAGLAPAVQVMYVIMMYISVYPIAMSVRSTNVYEDQSLGIFHPDEEFSAAERAFDKTDASRMATWGRYLAMHARHQLSFDMWWLALALFFVCIIERDNLSDTQTQGWFNIFSILFEIVSGYGSVGLSLGIPNQNYSLSGAFRPLSKLILCLVMIRGRHRGLPVAIDRAVVLPFEFERGVDKPPGPPPGTDEQRSSIGAASSPVGEFADDAEHGQATTEMKLFGGDKEEAAEVREHERRE